MTPRNYNSAGALRNADLCLARTDVKEEMAEMGLLERYKFVRAELRAMLVVAESFSSPQDGQGAKIMGEGSMDKDGVPKTRGRKKS